MKNRGLFFFMLSVLLLGINQGIMNSTFNNYLHDMFKFDASARGFMEFPREFPGFALILVTGLLGAFSLRVWGTLVGFFSMLGVVGLAFFSPGQAWLVVWVVVWSMGDHLFMPVESAMGLAFAEKGKEGKRLGQLGGWRNFAMIGGSGLVWLVMSFVNTTPYVWLYVIAGVLGLLSALAFWRVELPQEARIAQKAFVYRRKYHLYYWLNILFGARKQIFLTFAPWVLVSEFGVKAQTMAFLMMLAAGLGVVFRQVFGWCVDKFGERTVLAADALILVVICAGFAFSKNVYLLFALYVLDNLMFATRIARTTYLSKIVESRSHIAASISLGVSIDHLVSMSIPALGGILWVKFGYPVVFAAAAVIAVLNFVAAFKIPRVFAAVPLTPEAQARQ
jgi:MFS family permease